MVQMLGSLDSFLEMSIHPPYLWKKPGVSNLMDYLNLSGLYLFG